MAVVGHLGQHNAQPWLNTVLIEGLALTAQGQTTPFWSYYGFVLDADPMRVAVVVQCQFSTHVTTTYTTPIPFCVRQFPYLCHGAHGVQLVWPRADSGAVWLRVPNARRVRYAVERWRDARA